MHASRNERSDAGSLFSLLSHLGQSESNWLCGSVLFSREEMAVYVALPGCGCLSTLREAKCAVVWGGVGPELNHTPTAYVTAREIR